MKIMGIKRVFKKILGIPIVLIKIMMRILLVLFPYFLILLGLGIWLGPGSIPGLDKEISTYAGILVIGIGGALSRRQDIAARARIQAKVFKEVFDKDKDKDT